MYKRLFNFKYEFLSWCDSFPDPWYTLPFGSVLNTHTQASIVMGNKYRMDFRASVTECGVGGSDALHFVESERLSKK